MKKKDNRVLPSGELIFNRYDKAKYLNYGEGTSVYDTSVEMGDAKLVIGDVIFSENGTVRLEYYQNRDRENDVANNRTILGCDENYRANLWSVLKRQRRERQSWTEKK